MTWRNSVPRHPQGWHRCYDSLHQSKLEQGWVPLPSTQVGYLTLKWLVVEKFHKYLYGLTFNVYTDNNPLSYILMTAKLDAASHCWVTSLANYNFWLHYQARKANIDADALSRVSWPGYIPDSSGHCCSSVSCTRGCPQRAHKPHGGLQLGSACSGCSVGQSAGCLHDLRGLASSPTSGSCPETNHH